MNEKALQNAVILLTSFIVAVAMKLIGALLIDAIIILPALISTLHAKSMKEVIKWASLWGGIFAFTGFFASYFLKIPASSAIAVIATLVFMFFYFKNKFKK